ncbi:flavin reductase family protein [Oceanobacter antarcticus]|uniref:Flavin reductase family protein n=1 Tax=Oceanobacter antarcticus TaxID=3133425 RepID=A0ABW8NNW7_9GAMM
MSSATPFDPRQFRRALGNFACGVTIVTAIDADGNKVGVTANSFNSVSLDPPLILWSLDKRSSAWETFQAAQHFTVNILASNQIELSNGFARPADDKYAGISFRQGFGGAPVFDGCSGNFQCSLFEHIDAGDHWILIGKVEVFEDFGRAPLLYHQGGYAMVIPHPQGAKPNQDPAAPAPYLLDTRLGENVFYLMIQAVNASHPRFVQEQQKLGLHNIESRLLMVLESAPDANLQTAISMPPTEVEFRRICDGENRFHQGLPFKLRMTSKASNSAGLQLADLVARPIGRHILNPEQENRAFDVLNLRRWQRMRRNRL